MNKSQRFTAADKKKAELVADLIMSAVNGMVRRGELKVQGKTAEQFFPEVQKYLRRAENPKTEVQFTIDHTDTLLDEASRYAKKRNTLLSCVFLATWVEHFLNQMVESIMNRNARYRDYCSVLVRDMSLRAKFIWIHIQLEIPISSRSLRRLVEVSETRNYFIHYKWPAEDKSAKERTAKARRAGLLLIRYLQKIEEVHVLSNATPELARMREGLRILALQGDIFNKGIERAKAAKP